MRRLQGVGFAAFCLLAGSRWLVDNAFPSALPPLLEQCLHAATICVVAWLLWLVRARPGPAAIDFNLLRLTLAGFLLLGLPALLQVVGHGVTEASGAALFTLTPLFVVVGAVSYGATVGGRGLMVPAMIGVAGGLLLLPFQLPSNLERAAWFAAMLVVVLLAAGASVWLNGLLRGRSVALSVAFLCGGNALVLTLVLGVVAGFRGELHLPVEALSSALLRCILIDLPQIFLLVWLLREVTPSRLSARYLFAPLVAAVEGMVFLHPVIDLRMSAGLLLMAGGGAGLLFREEEDETAGTKLGLKGEA